MVAKNRLRTCWARWCILVRGLSLTVLLATAALVIAPLSTAEAASVAGRLTATPAPAIAGEMVSFKGAFPSRVKRPIQLERRDPVGWTKVAKGTTDSSGRFTIRNPAPASAGATVYQVVAPRAKTSRRTYPAVRTPTTSLSVVPQNGEILAPGSTNQAERFVAFATFTPARPGRAVSLERQSGGSWTTVQSGAQDVEGRVAWDLDAAGTYRAVAAWSRGAQQIVTGPHRVRERPLDEVWQPTDRCRDVVWLGARGSSQHQQDGDGMGAEVHGAWTHYRDSLQGVDAGFHGVTYPAIAANGSLAYPEYRRQFAASIDSGVDAVLDFMRARSECPDEHYVLAGYSQGAMVMDRALFQIAGGAGAQPPGLLQRIDGVLAIADGDKRAGQGGIAYATADPDDAYGISWAAEWATSSGTYDAVDQPVPDSSTWPAARFHDVCLRGDTICDYGTALLGAGIDVGIDLHSNGYRESGSGDHAAQGVLEVQRAASAIAATTRSLLRAGDELATQVLPDAFTGIPETPDYEQRLPDAEGRAGVWSIVSGNIPVGLGFTSSGWITGRPSHPGKYEFTAELAQPGGTILRREYALGVANIDLQFQCANDYFSNHVLAGVGLFFPGLEPHRVTVRLNGEIKADGTTSYEPWRSAGAFLQDLPGGVPHRVDLQVDDRSYQMDFFCP